MVEGLQPTGLPTGPVYFIYLILIFVIPFGGANLKYLLLLLIFYILETDTLHSALKQGAKRVGTEVDFANYCRKS